MTERLRVVVSGLIGSVPLAGLTAHYLQFVLGLRKLGHDVLYLEDTGWFWDPWSDTYWDEWSGDSSVRPAHPAAFLDTLMRAYDLGDSWTYVDIDGVPAGVSGRRLAEFVETADLFLHVTGGGKLRDDYLAIPRRARVDTDPGFFQIGAAIDGADEPSHEVTAHNVHFTFGCNIGMPGCSIPTLGLRWHPTRQPLDLSLWPVAPPSSAHAPFTTIINWRPYEPVEYNGKTYGLKDVEFKKFLRLPSLTRVGLELASEGPPPVPMRALKANGWVVREGHEVSESLDAYRRYIRSSRGEWSVAKNMYVDTWSGWFSERSAVYLASGRPVVAESTGYETWLPTGEGLFSFSTLDEAVAALESIEANYRRHCRAARDIAEAYFDYRAVLSDFVGTAMAS